jgi:putative transposase
MLGPAEGTEERPGATIVDPQTVKTTGVGRKERGFDPAKEVEGRKRHLLGGIEGLLMKAQVHSAKVPEEVARAWAREGKKLDWPRLWPARSFRVLPRRWVVERAFAWMHP